MSRVDWSNFGEEVIEMKISQLTNYLNKLDAVHKWKVYRWKDEDYDHIVFECNSERWTHATRNAVEEGWFIRTPVESMTNMISQIIEYGDKHLDAERISRNLKALHIAEIKVAGVEWNV